MIAFIPMHFMHFEQGGVERIKLIEAHNQKMMEIVHLETIQLREATRGRGGVW